MAELQEITPSHSTWQHRAPRNISNSYTYNKLATGEPEHRRNESRSAVSNTPSPIKKYGTPKLLFLLRWWVPEIFASVLSLASLISLIIVVRTYQGSGLQHLHLPTFLTLNGLVAIISTISRAALMVPVGSVISQEAWIWLSRGSRNPGPRGTLGDLEYLDAASRGGWGSMVLIFKTKRRYPLCPKPNEEATGADI